MYTPCLDWKLSMIWLTPWVTLVGLPSPDIPANHHVQRGSVWDLWPPQDGWKLTAGQEGGCEGRLGKLMPRTAPCPSWAASFSQHLSENGWWAQGL